MMHVRRLVRALIGSLLVWGFSPVGPAAAALTQTVTVTIDRIECATACDEQGIEGIGDGTPDWYAQVFMDGGDADPPRSDGPNDTATLTPGWVFSKTVPATQQKVDVRVQIWDRDTFDNDLADDTPQFGDKNLDFTVDLALTKVTGEIAGGIGTSLCTFGNGEDSDGAAYVCLTARTGDRDGDGLQDTWETNGIDFDGNGTIDLPLDQAPFNANPDRKDLYMEIDSMDCAAGGCAAGDVHSHRPSADAVNDVVTAFANAPVDNFDGSKGISLHAFRDESIPEVPVVLFQSNGPGTNDDFNDIKNGNPAGACTGRFGTSAERASADCVNVLAAKRAVFQYVIFGHTYSEATGSSGISELNSNGGNDLMVTFGGWTAAGIAGAGGQRVADASTLMHEFGHNLGLGHGGFEGKNCKPNYLSLMSYALQFPNIDNARPMDYSNATLPKLDETALPASGGVQGPAGRNTVIGQPGNANGVVVPANGPIDWDGKGGLTGDIDFISSINPGCNVASPGDTNMLGWDDWANLVYNFRSSKDFADGASRSTPVEITNDTVIAMTPLADLAVSKSVDKATALPGDTLTYTVTASNTGPGKAVGVSVTDTKPDSSTVAYQVGELAASASTQRTPTFLVPCTAADGSVVTNRASVTGTSMALAADPNAANNAASASTTIQAPKLTLTKTASGPVMAGDPISYGLSFANTGTATATNVVITDVLPAEVYYSRALDTGSGPKPTSVTANADGTTTLTWNIGTVAPSATASISYTARPSLLVLAGTNLVNGASITYSNTNGCTYSTSQVSASTTVTQVPPSRDPQTLGFWRTHPEQWTAQALARIQATDQRFDGADGSTPDGRLTAAEVTAATAPTTAMPRVTAQQFLATAFNLATRRINASTVISSKAAAALKLANVRDAGRYAKATLDLPLTKATQGRYSDITTVLDEINQNKSEKY